MAWAKPLGVPTAPLRCDAAARNSRQRRPAPVLGTAQRPLPSACALQACSASSAHAPSLAPAHEMVGRGAAALPPPALALPTDCLARVFSFLDLRDRWAGPQGLLWVLYVLPGTLPGPAVHLLDLRDRSVAPGKAAGPGRTGQGRWEVGSACCCKSWTAACCAVLQLPET